ncbi:hypothetical protein AURDEDRAFT_184809 [Auricularia subglabra TFB-10046 SS5]|nr:hypothetical protein AURDEDRAFT_184809 [Auricularia subglabra TFB-10046 SS5]
MSSCDFDLLSACGSLNGFPGQEDASLPLDSSTAAVADGLEDLEAFQLRDRARIAAIQASRTAAMSADRYPFESLSGRGFNFSPLELVYSGSTPMSADRVRALLSRDYQDFASGLDAPDSLAGMSAACPPTRPPTPAAPSSPSLSPVPSLCPPSPLSTCTLDDEEFRAVYPPLASSAPRYLDGEELLSRFSPREDAGGNARDVARYVPPARRARERRELEGRERRDRLRRRCESPEPAQPPSRVFYPTILPGVFDTAPPSQQRTLQVMAEQIADNCFNIAMSPTELKNQLSHLDGDALRTIHRITDLLRVNTPDTSRVKIARIIKCAIHVSYGLDFKCVTSTGSVVWYRDVNMRIEDPASQELVYKYLSDPRRAFSQEQIRKLRALPQYWHEEGQRIFVPMMRRAVPESVRRARAYV